MKQNYGHFFSLLRRSVLYAFVRHKIKLDDYII